MILFNVLLKRLFSLHHSLLKSKEYSVSYMKVLISIFSADLDIIIQVLSFFQYHITACYNNLEIYLDLLNDYIFISLEKFHQTHQVSSLFSFQNYYMMQTS